MHIVIGWSPVNRSTNELRLTVDLTSMVNFCEFSEQPDVRSSISVVLMDQSPAICHDQTTCHMTSADVPRNDEAAAVASLTAAASRQLVKPSFPTVADSETLLSQPTTCGMPQQRDER